MCRTVAPPAAANAGRCGRGARFSPVSGVPSGKRDVRVEIIETSSLGDRSYVVSDGRTAVVIDPQRDIDRVTERVGDLGARITHVLETHLHNDYVTGGLELSRTTGAEYVVPAGDDIGYPARRITDGEVIDGGTFTLRAIHTPGHTREHISYALEDASGTSVGVFTGGSMLYDSTGTHRSPRRRQHPRAHRRPVPLRRRLADELPADTEVYPTHGFGSFCAASATGRDSSTVGEQRGTPIRHSPRTRRDSSTNCWTTCRRTPRYYEHMGVINRDGPAAVDLSAPAPVDPAELRRRIEAGEWVVDLRKRTAFAAGHLGGSYGFELSDSL